MDPQDHVFQCLNTMPQLLSLIPTSYLLTNGKIERELKFFIGAAWELGNPVARAYVMEKKLAYIIQNEKAKWAQIDLLAFENVGQGGAIPKFWIETKCSFAKDHNDVKQSARDAYKQILAYTQILAENENNPFLQQCLACPAYIVHFLTSLPTPNDPMLPHWLMQNKFEFLRQNIVCESEALRQLYCDIAPLLIHSSAVVTISDLPATIVHAIIVRMNPVPIVN